MLGLLVTLRRYFNRLAVKHTDVVLAKDAEINGHWCEYVAYGVDHLTHADLLEILLADQSLLAAGVDVHHSSVVGRHQGPACALQACPHVVGFSPAHGLSSCVR